MYDDPDLRFAMLFAANASIWRVPMPKSPAVFRAAALFALGGAASYVLSGPVDQAMDGCLPSSVLTHLSLIPYAFALLSAKLFLRSFKAVLSVPLNVGVWLAAYTIAVSQDAMASFAAHILFAGVFGGLGVTLADSLCRPVLRSPKHLACTTGIGFLAALPFVVAKNAGGQLSGVSLEILFICSFAIWQAAVGTYLYWASASDDDAPPVLDGGSTSE